VPLDLKNKTFLEVSKNLNTFYLLLLPNFFFSFLEADPYCIVQCENKKYKSSVIKDCQSPEWNFQVIFYRRNPKNLPITVSIWNSNMALDSFIGQLVIDDTTCDSKELFEELHGKGKQSDELVPGHIKIFLENFKNLDDL